MENAGHSFCSIFIGKKKWPWAGFELTTFGVLIYKDIIEVSKIASLPCGESNPGRGGESAES